MFNKLTEINETSNIISTGAGTSIKERLKFLNSMEIKKPRASDHQVQNKPKRMKLSSEISGKLMHSMNNQIEKRNSSISLSREDNLNKNDGEEILEKNKKEEKESNEENKKGENNEIKKEIDNRNEESKYDSDTYVIIEKTNKKNNSNKEENKNKNNEIKKQRKYRNLDNNEERENIEKNVAKKKESGEKLELTENKKIGEKGDNDKGTEEKKQLKEEEIKEQKEEINNIEKNEIKEEENSKNSDEDENDVEEKEEGEKEGKNGEIGEEKKQIKNVEHLHRGLEEIKETKEENIEDISNHKKNSNDIQNKEETIEEGDIRNPSVKRSFCLKKDKREELQKENLFKKPSDNPSKKRESCVMPAINFQKLLSKVEKTTIEPNNNTGSTKAVPKKLDTNKFQMLIGKRLIGQQMKLPNELQQKKPESEAPKEPEKPKEKPLIAPIINPISKEKKFKRQSDVFRIATINYPPELRNLSECEKSKKVNSPSKSPKANEARRGNTFSAGFDFEILENFVDDSKRNSTENTSMDSSYTEGFLDSINYDEYLSELKQHEIQNNYRETFCEGFFLASFPRKNGSVIENSAKKLPASCGHSECSQLPSMKPEIIMRYPLEDSKNLELNNLAATICFPTGIKLCYSETDYPGKIKDYDTQITNQKGERYYFIP